MKLLAAALVAAAAASATPAATHLSGVSGTVRSAACGRVRPCGRVPAPTGVLVRNARTHARVIVAAIRDGHFRVPLAPGKYTLSLVPTAAASTPVAVTVEPHRFTVVVLTAAGRLR